MFMSDVKCPGNREECKGKMQQTNAIGQIRSECAACPAHKERALTKLHSQNEEIRMKAF